jgi:hypothetical protein
MPNWPWFGLWELSRMESLPVSLKVISVGRPHLVDALPECPLERIPPGLGGREGHPPTTAQLRGIIHHVLARGWQC